MEHVFRKLQEIDDSLPTNPRYKFIRLSIVTLFVTTLSIYYCNDINVMELLSISSVTIFIERYFLYCNSIVKILFALKSMSILYIILLRFKDINELIGDVVGQ